MRLFAAIPGAHVVLLLALASGPARAADVEDVFAAAEREDRAFAFARALELYERVANDAPSSPRAPLAAARAAVLRTHGEGDFAPLERLERVRRDPEASRDRMAIDALVRAAEAFPPGPVRVESWALAADAYASRLGREAEADVLRRKILADAHADAVLAAKVTRDAVDASLARGDLAEAEAALARSRGRATADVVQLVRRAARRRWVHLTSVVALALVALGSGLAIGVARRDGRGARVASAVRRSLRGIAAFAAWVGAVGALLALGYEGADAKPFLLLGAALVPTFAVARAWGAAAEGSSAAARVLRAMACACATLAVAFLVLEGTDVKYLEGVGL